MPAFEVNTNTRAPRIYRMSIWIRSFAVAFLLFSLAGLLGLLWSQRAGLQGRNVSEMIEWAAIALFASGWVVYVLSAKIILSNSAIEKRTILKRDFLGFNEILGRRERVHRNSDGSYIRYLQVIPRDGLRPALQFQKFYALDAGFFAWYDDLPDLDASDRMRGGGRLP